MGEKRESTISIPDSLEEDEGYFSISYFDKQPRLCHLNKTRPKRSNVKRPTTKNPQAKINSEPIYEELSNINCGSAPKMKENEETEKSLKKDLSHGSCLNPPKISLGDLDNVKLRRASLSTKYPNISKDFDRSHNRASNYFADSNNRRPLEARKSRNRMSMFEPNTYIAGGPNHPTKYLEVFALENPKFDQSILKKPPPPPPKKTLTIVEPPLQNIKNDVQPILKHTDSSLTKPNYTEEEITDNMTKTISPLPLFQYKPVVPIKLANPQPMNEFSKILGRNQPSIVSEISVKPALKQTTETSQTAPPVKLRPKKTVLSENSRPQSRVNKFTNRFSMFEPTCQKSFNKLNEYRPVCSTFESGDEIPKSIKERIKMFSQ